MNATFTHLSINVSDVDFYRKLLDYLGFKPVVSYAHGFGATDGTVSVWVFKTPARYHTRSYHRKATGLNHLAFRVADKDAVYHFYEEYLLANGIPVLYGGPALHPEYEPGYYAVYFEDPDRIKLEVMYIPHGS